MSCFVSDLTGDDDEDETGRSNSTVDRNKKKESWKLLADPMLGQGPQKVYRVEGVNPQVCNM